MTSSPTSWRVEPVGPLRGDVHVRGSKNAVTKHMVAALLGEGPSTIENCPDVGDVDITAGMLRDLGCSVDVVGSTVTVEPGPLTTGRVPLGYGGLNRIPILLVGPLLHRMGEVFVPLVGGDRIGARPVNFHVSCLEAMGAEVTMTHEGLEAKATKLHGARIRLPFPSVGATETVLLTAVLAEGRTVLENSAVEPEVIELALFLQRMGARVELRPDRRFVIEGVGRLAGGARHTLAGDRIEAFSYLVAGLVTGGRVRVHGCVQGRLVTGITALQRMGVRFEITDDWLAAEAAELRPAAVQTATHPGFMTDWQAPLVVLFTQCNGMSVLHESVYEGRFPYVAALKEMGAEVELFDACLGSTNCRFNESEAMHSAVIHGPTALHGADITVPDIRGGFAYLIAAAAAEGSSRLRDVHHLERGYHRPLEAFAGLGLHISRD